MSKRVQFIRHATAAADAFSGLEGELTVDTTKKEIRVHDGVTAGGIPQARADLDNVAGATTSVDGKLVAADKQKLVFITITQNVNLDTLESDVTAALADIIAIETKTDQITVTQPVNLDTMESDIVAIETKTDNISVSQAVNLDTMESDIGVNNAKVGITGSQASAIIANTAKVTNANHTGDVTGSGALIAQAAIISGKTALTGANLTDTDEFLINDAGALKRLDAVELKNYLYGPTVANHIRAGNTQILSGSDNIAPAFDIDTNIVKNTYESVGPTGSGADNIWTEMDVIPSNATVLIVDLQMDLKNAPGASGSMTLYAAEGDIASPSIGSGNQRATVFTGPITSNAVGRELFQKTVFLPLSPTNRDVKIRWTSANADNENLIMYYRGFMTD